nr:proline-rich receptor-like protein kinase perk8 [Quercus suber]
MRPNNILITHDHEALLGDFGLAKTQREDSEKSTETTVVGTLGYLNPEYAESGKVSTKTDVYAFGVVLLQLITGRSTTDKKLEGQSLVGWVVESLDYIIEKNPTCGIKIYSPVDSDSASSMPGSCESEVTTPDISESQCEDGSFSIGPTTSISSTSQMSITRPSSPPPQTSSSSSSSMPTLPEQSTLGGQKRRENQSEVSQNKSGLRYDEMLMYI